MGVLVKFKPIKDDRFSVYTDPAFGEVIREYVLASRTTFSDLAKKALREYIDRHPAGAPAVPRRRLPSGPRLKPRRS